MHIELQFLQTVAFFSFNVSDFKKILTSKLPQNMWRINGIQTEIDTNLLKITFYFEHNLRKWSIFWAYAFKISKKYYFSMTEKIIFMKISVWYMKKCRILCWFQTFQMGLKKFPKNIISKKIVKSAKSEKKLKKFHSWLPTTLFLTFF